jgi:hypothetical protein
MLYRNHAGDKPKVEASATIHPSAVVIGNVHIGEKVFVGPNAVIRADEPCPEGKVEAIVIEAEVNIQDGVIIHALGGSPVRIGKGSSLAHGAVVHGPCKVGENCFIGFKTFKAPGSRHPAPGTGGGRHHTGRQARALHVRRDERRRCAATASRYARTDRFCGKGTENQRLFSGGSLT